MSDIDPSSIPLLRRADGAEIYMTVEHIDRGADLAWELGAVLSHVEPTRTAEAVDLVWSGRTMRAVLLSIVPAGGGECLATIRFHPDHPVLLG